jgi:hypothetical protein
MTKEKPTTVREWILMIKDEEIRNKALRNMYAYQAIESTPGVFAASVSSAILSAFSWKWSPEGHGYWDKIFESDIELLDEPVKDLAKAIHLCSEAKETEIEFEGKSEYLGSTFEEGSFEAIDWLSLIKDDEIRKYAVDNAFRCADEYFNPKRRAKDVHQAIEVAFDWEETPQGFKYWDDIYKTENIELIGGGPVYKRTYPKSSPHTEGDGFDYKIPPIESCEIPPPGIADQPKEYYPTFSSTTTEFEIPGEKYEYKVIDARVINAIDLERQMSKLGEKGFAFADLKGGLVIMEKIK